MRERLIELVKPFVSGFACEQESGACELTDCRTCNARVLADHLLANGVIALPVAVGKKVYDIGEFLECDYHPQMYEFNAEYITLYRDGKELTFGIDGMDYKYSDFGKTVFLTREEAEKALKEAEG